MNEPALVLGWAEVVELPEWGIRGLRAKLDSGARTSALHVEEIEDLGGGRVGFHVVVTTRPLRRVRVEAVVCRRAAVRASSGHAEPRVFVRTALRLGSFEHAIEIGLVARETMRFRMLIGRSAVPRGALVDCARRYVLGRAARPRRRKARAR